MKNKQQYHKQYWEKNKKRLKHQHKIYYEKNVEKITKQKKKYNKIHHKKLKQQWRKYSKIYYRKHIEERKEYMKKYDKENKNKRQKYYLKNKKKLIQQRVKYSFKRRHNDINYNLRFVLRSRLTSALKYNIKSKATLQLLGCSVYFLKKYLEKRFTKGMTWKNYGFGKNKWVIDHIRPCASFDLGKKSEQLKCFHYSNLQPLWFIDNCIKKNNFIKEDKNEKI